jgi:uncharacterized protein YjbI with pentapeptide repeats
MIQFKIFHIFNTKKKIALIVLLIVALLSILGKNYISEVVKSPSIRIHLINIAKVAIPLKNLILMRNVDDKIALLKSSSSCIFCDLTQGNFEGNDLKGVDLRYANLSGANLKNANLSGANLKNANLDGANLQNANLIGTILIYTNLSEANLDGVDLRNNVLTGTILADSNLTGANLNGVYLRSTDLTGVNLSGLDFSNKNLFAANLTGANLSNTNLQDANLQNANLTGANLSNANLQYAFVVNANLTGTILTYTNLSGANLDGVDLRNKDLTGANLSGFDLRNKDLTGANLSGVDLRNKDLTGANLSGVDLRNKDLTGANLSGVDLSNKDLTGTILTYANLSGANLDGVDLRNKDLTGVNLSGVDLSGQDLSETILKDAKKIEINLKTSTNANWPLSDDIKDRNVTRYDLSGNSKYVSTKGGLLFELINNKLRLVLDLNKNDNFYFTNWAEGGLLGVASQNNKVFVSYSIRNGENDNSLSLVVNEYSMNFSKVRNIIRIDGFTGDHFAGGLLLDSKGQLYLAVGDADQADENAQNLNSLKGKILRLDVSESNLKPEIIAYGIRNPWGVTIDSNDRMFVSQCGSSNVESVYLLNDLYPDIPVNLGWPVFEGSQRIRRDPLTFNDVLAPIFEYNYRPGCVTGGVYLNDIESFLFADLYGTIRLLKQQENGEWYLLHEYKQDEFIWGFGFDKKTKKIFVAPKNLELEILVDQVKLNQ